MQMCNIGNEESKKKVLIKAGGEGRAGILP
jgi:hypothetical protein